MKLQSNKKDAKIVAASVPKGGKRGWYNDYLKHENAQYRMTFLEYKRLRQEGKIK